MIQTNSNHFSYRTAIYCRLFKDDEQKGESASIQNQRDMLEHYVKARGWNIVDVYIDDGYTGLNTNRPSFQRLIKDVEDRRIDIVITKDLSRLGRNYLQTGYYTENFFPKNGVRYIAVNDGVDTLQDNNEIVPFKNVLNEFYSRDVSKKMKSAYLTRARQGKFTGCLAPFGYMKNPDDTYGLMIDEQTSWIVKKIYELAISGYGVQAIRRILFNEKIPTPTWWNRKRGLRNKITKLEQTVKDGEYWWDCTTIKEIIQNPVYLGHIASQKANYQFKIGWLSDKPKDEWIVIENTHEPIVSVDDYKIANEKIESRKRPFKTGEESIFTGLVKCPDCGKALNLGRNNSKKKEKILTCNTYRRYGKNLCTQHRIYFDTLYEIVLADIRKNSDFALKDEREVLKALEKLKDNENEEEQIYIAKKIEEDSKRVAELGNKIEKLYDDWINKKISENNFQRILEKTQQEQDILTNRIEEMERKVVKSKVNEDGIYKWIELIFKTHTNYDTAVVLADKNEVFEAAVPLRNTSFTVNISGEEYPLYKQSTRYMFDTEVAEIREDLENSELIKNNPYASPDMLASIQKERREKIVDDHTDKLLNLMNKDLSNVYPLKNHINLDFKDLAIFNKEYKKYDEMDKESNYLPVIDSIESGPNLPLDKLNGTCVTKEFLDDLKEVDNKLHFWQESILYSPTNRFNDELCDLAGGLVYYKCHCYFPDEKNERFERIDLGDGNELNERSFNKLEQYINNISQVKQNEKDTPKKSTLEKIKKTKENTKNNNKETKITSKKKEKNNQVEI